MGKTDDTRWWLMVRFKLQATLSCVKSPRKPIGSMDAGTGYEIFVPAGKRAKLYVNLDVRAL